jgi:NADH dehydrogenase/NADH:ubiquinone oxidoreductase subunit G
MKYTSFVVALLVATTSALRVDGDDAPAPSEQEVMKNKMKPVQPVMPLPAVAPWDPKHNENDGLVQDFYDVAKTMRWIEALEKKLEGTEPTDNFVSKDWEMLKSLKKSMGMKTEFKTISDVREEKRVEKSGWDQKGPVETANTTPGTVDVDDLNKLTKWKKDRILKERAAIKGEEPKSAEDLAEEEKKESKLLYIPSESIYLTMNTPVESYKAKADSLATSRATAMKQLTTMDTW